MFITQLKIVYCNDIRGKKSTLPTTPDDQESVTPCVSTFSIFYFYIWKWYLLNVNTMFLAVKVLSSIVTENVI